MFGKQPAFTTAGIPDLISFCPVVLTEQESSRVVGLEVLHLICHIFGGEVGG